MLGESCPTRELTAKNEHVYLFSASKSPTTSRTKRPDPTSQDSSSNSGGAERNKDWGLVNPVRQQMVICGWPAAGRTVDVDRVMVILLENPGPLVCCLMKLMSAHGIERGRSEIGATVHAWMCERLHALHECVCIRGCVSMHARSLVFFFHTHTKIRDRKGSSEKWGRVHDLRHRQCRAGSCARTAGYVLVT